MRKMVKFAKYTMGRELASSETATHTKEISNTDSFTEKANSAGLMEQSTEVNSEVMKSLEMDVTNGQMDQLMKVRSKMVFVMGKENTSTPKKV